MTRETWPGPSQVLFIKGTAQWYTDLLPGSHVLSYPWHWSTINFRWALKKFLAQSAVAHSSNFKVERHYEPNFCSPQLALFNCEQTQEFWEMQISFSTYSIKYRANSKILYHLSIAQCKASVVPERKKTWELSEKALLYSKVISLVTLSNILFPSPFSSNYFMIKMSSINYWIFMYVILS